MHFLRTLVFSSALYASAALAATIPVGGENLKDVEITIKIHSTGIPNGAQAAVSLSEQSVFSTINSLPERPHLFVYAFSPFSSLMVNTIKCKNFVCTTDSDCPAKCSGCDQTSNRVRFNFCKSTRKISMLISTNYSATPRLVFTRIEKWKQAAIATDAFRVLLCRRGVFGGSTVVFRLCLSEICGM